MTASWACIMQGGRSPTEEGVAADARMERVTAAIMAGALRYSAVDAYDAFAALNDLKTAARLEMAKVDLLLVPSAAHHYMVAGACARSATHAAFPPACSPKKPAACASSPSCWSFCSPKRSGLVLIMPSVQPRGAQACQQAS